MKNGQIAKITIEVTIFDDRVEGIAKAIRWTSEHGGRCIKTTPWSTRYGRGTAGIAGEDKSLKQAILEATEPQIDFSMEDIGLAEAVEAR